MFNINENTEIIGLENINCSIAHIQACLHDKNKYEAPTYTYDGAKVQKGTIVLHTCKGDCVLAFDVKNAWARKIEIVNL